MHDGKCRYIVEALTARYDAISNLQLTRTATIGYKRRDPQAVYDMEPIDFNFAKYNHRALSWYWAE